MSEARGLDLFNQLHREKVEKDILEMEEEVREREKLLEHYRGMKGIDHISYWDMDGPESITDLEDRKRLIEYFYQNLGRTVFRKDVVECGIFWSFKNIPFFCEFNRIECPSWFLEKYPLSVYLPVGVNK